MNSIKKEDEGFTTFTSIVNDQCEGRINFRCLIFMQGLVSTKEAEIRRGLNKLENEPNLTL